MASETAKHSLMDGKLHVFRRERSGFWQCGTFLAGRYRRASTKTDSLAQAKDIARDWFLTLHGKLRDGSIRDEKTFKDAAAPFEREYEDITGGERSARYIETMKQRLRVHLIPYFGDMPLSEITSGRVQEYRQHRLTPSDEPLIAKNGKALKHKRPARSTLHQEIVALRQTLKYAMRQGWLDRLPDLSAPYKTSGKLSHRAWFSPDEYKTLYTATRKRVERWKGTDHQWGAEQLHDYVLFMANTGLRPDESAQLEFRDVVVIEEGDEKILEIEVRGKRGVGYCKSTRGAVRPYDRLRKRATSEGKKSPDPTTRLFPITHRNLFNAILREEKLKKDRDGKPRTAYSLRHTYICFRLMEGADIYQVAKNCRTSVEMIQNFYAAHIRTSINASAINVRRPKASRAKS